MVVEKVRGASGMMLPAAVREISMQHMEIGRANLPREHFIHGKTTQF
jgi:hypothetical protein